VNIKEYIESGILEAYVMDALDTKERANVAANIAMYPELAAEVAAIETAMQHFAEATSQDPPPYMKEHIWEAIQLETTKNEPSVAPKVVAFPPENTQKDNGWARAAMWAILAGSVVTNFMLLSSNKHSQGNLVALQQHMDSMNTQQQQLVSSIKAYQKERSMLMDTSMQTIVMHSMLQGHDMAGMVFVSKTKGDTYLALHNLPMPPKGKQYQLWVIKDGKPVDMGVIPNDMVVIEGGMEKISKPFTGGQAFAVSLEKEGGSPVPTMEQIYVLGKMSS